MSKQEYTKEQIKELTDNPNVLKCSSKYITFNNEFKLIAVKLDKEGMIHRNIFRKFGFPEYIINSKIPERLLKNWRYKARHKLIESLSIYQKKIDGFKDLFEENNSYKIFKKGDINIKVHLFMYNIKDTPLKEYEKYVSPSIHGIFINHIIIILSYKTYLIKLKNLYYYDFQHKLTLIYELMELKYLI